MLDRAYYVQTSNRYFPVELRFQFPLFRFLPEVLPIAVVQRVELVWYRPLPDAGEVRRHVRSIRLLTRREVPALFSEAVFKTERCLGLPKSFLAVSGPGLV